MWLQTVTAGSPSGPQIQTHPHSCSLIRQTGRSPDDGEALHRLVAKGAGPGPYVFFADDLDAVFERAQAAGAEILQEPIDQPWGTRDFALRDPAGNLVRINQARK